MLQSCHIHGWVISRIKESRIWLLSLSCHMDADGCKKQRLINRIQKNLRIFFKICRYKHTHDGLLLLVKTRAKYCLDERGGKKRYQNNGKFTICFQYAHKHTHDVLLPLVQTRANYTLNRGGRVGRRPKKWIPCFCELPPARESWQGHKCKNR